MAEPRGGLLRLQAVTWSRGIGALAIAAASVGCGQGASGGSASDAPVARWQLAKEVGQGDESLSLVVQEIECASGRSAEGRIDPPDVEYREDALVITVRVERIGDSADCPGNPDTPYELDLDEPVGDRTLLDGGRTPPAPPVVVSR